VVTMEVNASMAEPLPPTSTLTNSSGASQEFANMSITQPPGLARRPSDTFPLPNTTTHANTTNHQPSGSHIDNTTAFQLPNVDNIIHQNNKWNNLITETIENDILEMMDIIQASKAINNDQQSNQNIPNIQQLQLATTQQIVLFLEAIAYNPKHHDPLRVLGLFELDGPTPTEELVEHRRKVATKIIEHFANPQLHTEASDLIQHINEAAEQCNELLPTVHQTRKTMKGINKNTPRWLELGHTALDYFQQFAATLPNPQTKIATQLSQIAPKHHRNNNHAPNTSNIASITESRALYTNFNSPPNIINTTIAALSQPVITWAPENGEQCMKLASAYREARLKGIGPEYLILLAPIDPIPGCDDTTKILDIWKHPLLNNKLKDIISNIHFSTPAHTIYTSGKTSPQQTQKDMAIFTLQLNNYRLPPQLTHWTTTQYKFNNYTTIWIDCPSAHKWHIYHSIDNLHIPGIITTDKPRPSRGSSNKHPQSTIKIHLGDDVGSQLQVQTVVSYLMKQFGHYQAIVGQQALLTNHTTKLVELEQPAALLETQHLWKGAVIVTPRIAIVESDASAALWGEALTAAWTRDPENAPTRICYRESHAVKSKTYAMVHATKEQMVKTKNRGGHKDIQPDSSKPETLRAILTTKLDVDGGIDRWLPGFMQQLGFNSGVAIKQASGDGSLLWNEWKPLLSFEGGWTGSIVIQTSSKQELLALQRAAQTTMLEIQGHVCAATIGSEWCDL
jgi:hypothetical protein